MKVPALSPPLRHDGPARHVPVVRSTIVERRGRLDYFAQGARAARAIRRKCHATLILLVVAVLPAASWAADPSQAEQAAALPDLSLYHLEGEWRTQEGTKLELPDLAGRPRLLSFVYTYCEHTCPTIVARLKAIADHAEGESASNLQVTLVSLDPGRDTPERMKAYMAEQGLDARDWLILHGDPDEVLGFAAMLGVRYRPMGDSDIAHSNMITLLDAEGVVRYQSKGLDDDPQAIVEAIEALDDPDGA